jgi:hypothetical protein
MSTDPTAHDASWLHHRRQKRAHLSFCAASILTLFTILYLFTPRDGTGTVPLESIEAFLPDPAELAKDVNCSTNAPNIPSYPTLESTTSKYAYATFLTPPADIDDGPLEDDKYFIATRILTYQLLHAAETRTTRNYPFIVLVTPDLNEAKRERLRKDGAIVLEVQEFDHGWVETPVYRWSKVLAKLRLWELTQFERICFLDGDSLMQHGIDGVFDGMFTLALGYRDQLGFKHTNKRFSSPQTQPSASKPQTPSPTKSNPTKPPYPPPTSSHPTPSAKATGTRTTGHPPTSPNS